MRLLERFLNCKSRLAALRRDERGIALAYFTICLPIALGFGTLVVQGSYVMSQRNLLQVTAETAALAAAAQLPTSSAAVSAAQSYAAKNMPSASYGNVLASGDVIHHRIQLAFPEMSTVADTDRALARVNRMALIERLADSPTILVPAHFPPPVFGRVVRAGQGFAHAPITAG